MSLHRTLGFYKMSPGVSLDWGKGKGYFFLNFTHHAMLALVVMVIYRVAPKESSLAVLWLCLTVCSSTVSLGRGHSQLFHELGEVTDKWWALGYTKGRVLDLWWHQPLPSKLSPSLSSYALITTLEYWLSCTGVTENCKVIFSLKKVFLGAITQLFSCCFAVAINVANTDWVG